MVRDETKKSECMWGKAKRRLTDCIKKTPLIPKGPRDGSQSYRYKVCLMGERKDPSGVEQRWKAGGQRRALCAPDCPCLLPAPTPGEDLWSQ